MSAISIPTPPPAKARTARCAREQDRGGGSGVEGGYAVGLWPARRGRDSHAAQYCNFQLAIDLNGQYDVSDSFLSIPVARPDRFHSDAKRRMSSKVCSRLRPGGCVGPSMENTARATRTLESR